MALRSVGVQASLVILCILIVAATALGIGRTKLRQQMSQAVDRENHMVKEVFRNVLEGKLDSAEISEEASSRQGRIAKQLRMTAKSPYMVSHATDLWDVTFFPSPLSAISVGESRSWPDIYRIHGLSLAKTVERNERISPTASQFGPFDIAFVVMVIAPLVVLGLTFNVASRDRESGMQNLIAAQTLSVGKLMAIRCFVRATLVIAVVAIVVNPSLMVAFWSQFDTVVIIDLLIWNIVTALYLMVWASVSFFINSFAKSSLANGGAILLLWLLLTLLIPRIVSNTVQENFPTLPETALAELEQAVIDSESENANTLVERFREGHPDIEIRSDDAQQLTLIKYLLVHDAAGRNATDNVHSFYLAHLQRAEAISMCSWLSPTIAFQSQADYRAGNSIFTCVGFAAVAADLQAQAFRVFLVPSIKNEENKLETVSKLPNFMVTGNSMQASVWFSVHAIAAMAVWFSLLLVGGALRFQYRVRGQVDKEVQAGGPTIA